MCVVFLLTAALAIAHNSLFKKYLHEGTIYFNYTLSTSQFGLKTVFYRLLLLIGAVTWFL